jgi:hypothetical protein
VPQKICWSDLQAVPWLARSLVALWLPRKKMRKVSLIGVIVGGIVDIVATNILALPLVIPLLPKLRAQGTAPDQMSAALVATIHSNFSLLCLQLLIGLAGSAIGGYVAAWIAKRGHLLNGALSAWLCLLTGIYGLFTIKAEGSMQMLQIVDFIIAPLAGMLGGYLRFRTGVQSR